MAILIENRQKKTKIARRPLRAALHKVLTCLGRSASEVSLVLTDNAGIQVLNRDYLGRDYPTNVLSFSQTEGEFGLIRPDLLGDIVVSVERADADARESGVPCEDMLLFYAIHGLLHLLGYDHGEAGPVEGERMQQKEDELFFLVTGYRIDRQD